MNNKYILITIVFACFALAGFFTYKTVEKRHSQNELGRNHKGYSKRSNEYERKQNVNTTENCVSDGCLEITDLNYPAKSLSDNAKTALNKALDDEYKAQATYEATIEKLGNVRPFIMIIRAEEQHISALKSLFDKYGMQIPTNPYTNKIVSAENLTLACKAGVDAEISNAQLYKNDLLPNVTEYQDITNVFTNLMNASQQKHLVAFERCAN